MSTTPHSDDRFTEKWRARWPEWALAEVFVPVAQRDMAEAWFALLQEFADAAWGGADPTPGLAKLAWWQEELRGWAKGARRHPLGSVLQPVQAPWHALADAMPVLRYRELPSDPAAASSALHGFGQAAAAVEAALFAAPASANAAPFAMLGGFYAGAGDARAASVLLAQALPGGSSARPVRLFATLLRLRMAALASGRPVQAVPRWHTLWSLWRAARD